MADYTAILKLIETRFGLPPLTARDASEMDMTEFFRLPEPGVDDAADYTRATDEWAVLFDHLP